MKFSPKGVKHDIKWSQGIALVRSRFNISVFSKSTNKNTVPSNLVKTDSDFDTATGITYFTQTPTKVLFLLLVALLKMLGGVGYNKVSPIRF